MERHTSGFRYSLIRVSGCVSLTSSLLISVPPSCLAVCSQGFTIKYNMFSIILYLYDMRNLLFVPSCEGYDSQIFLTTTQLMRRVNNIIDPGLVQKQKSKDCSRNLLTGHFSVYTLFLYQHMIFLLLKPSETIKDHFALMQTGK